MISTLILSVQILFIKHFNDFVIVGSSFVMASISLSYQALYPTHGTPSSPPHWVGDGYL
jgi:hypothetical protein